MQDNYGDETKRAAAVKTGGADVPAAAAETAVPAASNTDTPTMPPGHKLVDPFTHYAAIEGGDAFFNGDYARIDPEHGWVRGREKEPIGATEAFVANMHEARHGHIKFAKSDGESVEHRTARSARSCRRVRRAATSSTSTTTNGATGGRSSTCRYDRSPILTTWCASPAPARARAGPWRSSAASTRARAPTARARARRSRSTPGPSRTSPAARRRGRSSS